MAHRFFHPDQCLEPFGMGWVMVRDEGMLGAVVPLGNGYYGAIKKEGEAAVPVPGRSSSRAAAAVRLWNATHPVPWGDRR